MKDTLADPPTDASAVPASPTAVRGRGWGSATFWGAALAAYWGTLLVGTHLPAQSLPGGLFELDKLLHLGAYAVLTTLAMIASRRLGFASTAPTRGAVAGLVLAYGAIDELTQPLVGRSCTLDDWIADAVGVGLALAIDTWRHPPAKRSTASNDGQ